MSRFATDKLKCQHFKKCDNGYEVEFDSPQKAVTVGQMAVFIQKIGASVVVL